MRHKADALAGGQVFGIHRIAQQFGAAFGGRHQAGQHFHGGGFAATVGAQKSENFPSTNGKADVVNSGEIAELKRQVVGFNGDIAVVADPGRNHQRLIAVTTVALVVGKSFIQLAVGRCGGQLFAQACGNQLAPVEHQAVFKLLGLFHVGRGHQQRQLRALAAYVFDQLPKAPPRQRVNASGGLIENQQIRLVDQCAAQPELLFHAARELARRAIGKALQVSRLEQLLHALFAFFFRQAEQRAEKADVFTDGQFGVEVAAQPLGHKGNQRVQRVAVMAVINRAAQYLKGALLEFFDPGNQPEQARFARAIRANQAATCAFGQAERNVDQRLLFAVPVVDATGVERQVAHCRLAGQSTSAVRT